LAKNEGGFLERRTGLTSWHGVDYEKKQWTKKGRVVKTRNWGRFFLCY